MTNEGWGTGMDYYLLDLERTLAYGKPYFWKSNKHGYTTDIQFAGLFSRKEATEISRKDLYNRTIMVDHKTVEETSLLGIKANEST